MRSIECYIVKKTTNLYEIQNKNIDSYLSILNESSPLDSFFLYLNKELLEIDKDFYFSNGIIYFSNEVEEGSLIEVIDEISKEFNKVITKNSYDRNSLFKLYSKDLKLKYNHKYILTADAINVDDIKDFKYTVYASHDPFYTTVSQIRTDCNDFIIDLSDEQIAKMIYLNSKIAKECLDEKNDSASSSGITTNKTIPRYVKNYVRYKTDIDLCTSIYLAISGKFGSINKTIGSINISKDIKLPYLKDILKKFEEYLKPLEDNLKSHTFSATAFVKAKTQFPYPGKKRYF